MSGNVDIVLGAAPGQIPRVAHDPRFRVYHQVNSGAQAIFWKCTHPLFQDARVRRALTLAIDRQELLRLLYLPSDLPITDGVFTLRQFRRGQFPPPLPYDRQQAAALLEAAGWQRRNGDRLRERDGSQFRFTAITWNTRGMDRLAVYVQAMLRRVGLHMDIQILDPAFVWARLGAGDFEAAFMIHQPGADKQQKYFGRHNPIGYRNPEVARLTDKVVATAEPDELGRIYRALTEIFQADVPVTRLLAWTTTCFAHRRVRGLRTPFHADPDTYIEDLWLEDRSD